MIVVTCKCKDCQGRKAAVPYTFWQKVLNGATEGRNVHGTVWNAHDPSMVGRAVRAQTGIEAVSK